MHWRRVEPVQHVGGLLVRGGEARVAALANLLRRKAHFPQLDFAHGSDWLVLLPTALISGGEKLPDLTLPRLVNATPLYCRLPNTWLPVGWEAGVPAHVEPVLVRAMLARESITDAVAIVPKAEAAETADSADLYVLGRRRAVADLCDRDLGPQ